MRLVSVFLAVTLVLISASTVVAGTDKTKPFVQPYAGGLRQLLDCSNAVPINCGETVSGLLTLDGNNVEYYSCVGWQETAGEHVYEFVIPAGTCYEVTMTLSNYTGDPDVFILGSCDENDCIDYAHISTTTECLESGTYYIVVDGYYSAPTGPYDLLITCEECTCPTPPCCPFAYTCYSFDFNEWDGGFQTLPCGGYEVWEWALLNNPDVPPVACDDVPVTNCLGTVVNGDYGDDAGHTAYIGPVRITECCWCMELCHFYDTENAFDGGNVKVSEDLVNWTLITPARLYDVTGYTYQPCVPGEDVFCGHQSNTTWLRDCFNLSDFVGQEIYVGFFFGSDGSVGYYPGWYIKWVKFGSDQPTGAEESSWGSIKAMYR